jgi:hypothetical protein
MDLVTPQPGHGKPVMCRNKQIEKSPSKIFGIFEMVLITIRITVKNSNLISSDISVKIT